MASGRYSLSVSGHFSAAHTLADCPPCDRLHGHTWKVQATWIFSDLDNKGMGENFSVLKGALKSLILDRYDHAHLNELEPFTQADPTAENLAKAFFLILREQFDPGPSGTIQRVEVWEGENSCAAYETVPD